MGSPRCSCAADPRLKNRGRGACGVDLAGDDVVQGDNRLRRDQDGIDGPMRRRSVRALQVFASWLNEYCTVENIAWKENSRRIRTHVAVADWEES